MPTSKLIPLSYYDPAKAIRLNTFADTLVFDETGEEKTLCAIRFGGYPEMVPAMADAIYGGASIEAKVNGGNQVLHSRAKGYRRQYAHDGVYATATMMANDDEHTVAAGDEEEVEGQTELQPRCCYLLCPAGDPQHLFEELDRKTAAPLIPAFRDYVLSELTKRGILHKLTVVSIHERMEAWRLNLLPNDENVVAVLEEGLKKGLISIPGAVTGQPDGFEGVTGVTGYLNAFGVTVADRIKQQFKPLFDPAAEPLSEEVLAINDYIQQTAGYSLYDAQLAVAEAVKRQLSHKKLALIIAECGAGKSKIGSVAMASALCALREKQHSQKKTFNLIMCPSHITKKWVREIGETLPDTFAMVVHCITDLERLYALYSQGDKSVYAIFSKEKARDGFMKAPAVLWSRRKKAFVCPDCGEIVEMEFEGYPIRADQFHFRTETKKNHTCQHCGTPLWMPVNPGRKLQWVRIGGYGWVHRYGAAEHLEKTKEEAVVDKLLKITKDPDGVFPAAGACRRFPLSTYIRKKMRGRIDGFIIDELHEYNNDSGQGDAMGEIYQTCRKAVGMTATLINGYSSGIFYLLYRVVPHLMQLDGKDYSGIGEFNAEYGVVETTYTVQDPAYAANRRAVTTDRKTRQLPGVSPLVFSRFLLEHAVFLSLSDMGKDLPDYEEIPVPLAMPEEIQAAYKRMEEAFTRTLKTMPKIKNKILSAFLNLLTVYPDQPYDQKPVLDPITGSLLVKPQDMASADTILPKEQKVLEIVRRKVAAGEQVLIYTSWVRTDSQKKLLNMLRSEGYRAEILYAKVSPSKREEWVEKRVNSGLQVLITNPSCVETGLDLNAFTTLIFYSLGYKLFTLRQASRRSWRINQMAPRIEVYLLYYKDTMQAKAIKLMASKLAVAGIIEGQVTDEGLAAMSEVKDMTSQMAKELVLGIRDSVEDIAATFKKMAIINPKRHNQPEAAKAGWTNGEVAHLPEETQLPYQNDLISPPTFNGGIRAAEHEARQTMYDGLLERTIEHKKHKSKKRAVDKNQLSLFDFVA